MFLMIVNSILKGKERKERKEGKKIGRATSAAPIPDRRMTDTRRSARPATFFERVDEFERQLLTDPLEAAHGNEQEAARALGC